MFLWQIILKNRSRVSRVGIQPYDWTQGSERDKTGSDKQSQLDPGECSIIVFAAFQYVMTNASS